MIEADRYVRLRRAKTLPSPPAVAVRLLEMADDPDVTIGAIVSVIELDPALTAKLLRLARSPLYLRQRPAETVREAAIALGLNTVITASLSFSLLPPRSTEASLGSFWERSVLCSAAARVAAAHVPGVTPDEAALVGLLSDIGMLALDRIEPALYASVPNATADRAPGHAEVIAHERRQLGGDHAEISSWILRSWRLPEAIAQAVALSHDGYDGVAAADPLCRVAALASLLTDVVVEGPDRAEAMRSFAVGVLGMSTPDLHDMLARLAQLGPEIATLFDVDVGDTAQLAEDAQELLLLRQARVDDEQDRLREMTESLAVRTEQLEIRSRHDALTGVATRGHLQEELALGWEQCLLQGVPLSVVFVDLDHFKRVNDGYGHLAGDRVLEQTGHRLRAVLGPGMSVGRYGGEEFVLVLPGIDATRAAAVAEALLSNIRRRPYDVGANRMLSITASAGVATAQLDHDGSGDPEELVARADAAVYEAKRCGRDRWVTAPAVADRLAV